MNKPATYPVLPHRTRLEEVLSDVQSLGAAVYSPVLETNDIDGIVDRLPPLSSAGTRTLLDTEVGRQTADRLLPIAQSVLGPDAYPIRAILFDKSPDANWNLGFHQDTKIPVKAKHEVDGYTHWSVKEGIPHCRPPVEFLEQMLAIRLALDDNDESNGPLLISPRTHRQGFISAETTNPTVESQGVIAAHPYAGDVVLMKPLALHASGKSTSPKHRRVIHIEYASFLLPSPLEIFFGQSPKLR